MVDWTPLACLNFPGVYWRGRDKPCFCCGCAGDKVVYIPEPVSGGHRFRCDDP